jgi:hypothetical protein
MDYVDLDLKKLGSQIRLFNKPSDVQCAVPPNIKKIERVSYSENDHGLEFLDQDIVYFVNTLNISLLNWCRINIEQDLLGSKLHHQWVLFAKNTNKKKLEVLICI